MGLLSSLGLRVVNDLVHDLAAGAWPGAVTALWLLRKGAKSALPPDAFATTLPGWSAVLLIMLAALAVLVVTGIVRVNYRSLGVPPDLLRARTRAAVIKHVVFSLVFIFATVAAIALLQP